MIVYLDADYRCHLQNNADASFLEVETDAFQGFAPEVIESYRFIPQGHSWTNAEGVTFMGEMAAPWVISSRLQQIQWEYDKAMSQQYKTECEELKVQQEDMETALKILLGGESV